MEALSAVVSLVVGLPYQALSLFLNIWVIPSIVGILVGVQIMKGLYTKKVGPHSLSASMCLCFKPEPYNAAARCGAVRISLIEVVFDPLQESTSPPPILLSHDAVVRELEKVTVLSSLSHSDSASQLMTPKSINVGGAYLEPCDNQFVLPLQIVPVGVAKGWNLQNVAGGLRVWAHRPPLVTQKAAAAATSRSSTWNLLASSLKVELLPQVCLNLERT